MSTVIIALCGFTCGFAPREAPTSRPAEPAAPPAVHRMQPLEQARVGDWAIYHTLDGRMRLEVRHTTLLLAEIETRVALNGKPVGLPAVRSVKQTCDDVVDSATADGAAVRASTETLDAAGRRWRCRRTVATWTRDGETCERRVWMHPEAPVYGIVRSELRVDGKLRARTELLDFGHGSAEPPPNGVAASQPGRK